jgi:hypothetical protein
METFINVASAITGILLYFFLISPAITKCGKELDARHEKQCSELKRECLVSESEFQCKMHLRELGCGGF